MDSGSADKKSTGNGLSELFVSLLSRNQSAIFGYILSLLPKWSDAEDVMQETSVVLWQKFDQFDYCDASSGFARWACRIAHFKVLNHMKKHCRDHHIFSDELLGLMSEESVDDMSRLGAERQALSGCLDKLHARQRQLVKNCYYGNATIKQIAQRTGRTPNSLYKSLNRIREQLLQCIERALAAGGDL